MNNRELFDRIVNVLNFCADAGNKIQNILDEFATSEDVLFDLPSSEDIISSLPEDKSEFDFTTLYLVAYSHIANEMLDFSEYISQNYESSDDDIDVFIDGALPYISGVLNKCSVLLDKCKDINPKSDTFIYELFSVLFIAKIITNNDIYEETQLEWFIDVKFLFELIITIIDKLTSDESKIEKILKQRSDTLCYEGKRLLNIIESDAKNKIIKEAEKRISKIAETLSDEINKV